MSWETHQKLIASGWGLIIGIPAIGWYVWRLF